MIAVPAWLVGLLIYVLAFVIVLVINLLPHSDKRN